MRQNRVEEVAEESTTWVKRNVVLVSSVGGLVVIILAVLAFFAWSRGRADIEARHLYDQLPTPETTARTQALEALLLKYPETTVAEYARLDYGDDFFANKEYGKAEEQYQQVLAKCGTKSEYGQRAQLGLAYCAEQKAADAAGETKDFDRVRKLYKQIAEGDGIYAWEAKRMLKRLENPPAIPAAVTVPAGPAPTEPVTPPAGTSGK